MPKESHLRRICRAEFDCNPKTFLRAAAQRLDAARLLLDSGLFLDAVYLGGYVVECGLKALILHRTPASRRRGACQELTTGARAHNYDVLTAGLKAKGCPIPREIQRRLDDLNEEWRTNLRYSGALIPEGEAEESLESVEAVHQWVEGSL